jgi:hypothetical protein
MCGAMHPEARSRPRRGDVVITPDDRRPCRYAAAQLPGAPQVIWPSRQAAIEAAQRFARQYGVDVWMQEGGALTRVTKHRRPDSGSDRSTRRRLPSAEREAS